MENSLLAFGPAVVGDPDASTDAGILVWTLSVEDSAENRIAVENLAASGAAWSLFAEALAAETPAERRDAVESLLMA